jgi:Protein of unknown function (DUF3800)
MLFFIDESWQEIGGREVGALGGVGIPEPRYNHFCREVFAFKRDVLGAEELRDKELKGTSCFAKSAFKKREASGHSRLLEAAEKMFEAIEKHKGKVFLIWTADPTLSLLNNPNSVELSKPYKQLLFDMRALMRNEEPKFRGALTFDQRHHREDEAAACAISNYLFRARGDWSKRFTQIPNFTSSAISPGLQAADLVVYLGPHLADPTQRPELAPYVERIKESRYEFRRGRQQRLVKTIRRVG